ncbi:restriction endonuclease [Bacillus cereus group sp. RP43]|uniref:restriction endonuclease n=1 Tax=Bacillus cereus group sp. RP43 TaxID=3040260 RepID=UPI003393A545
MSYKAIALVQSNIEECRYIVSIGGFSKNAKRYAKELNVELIDRYRLAEMYMEFIEGLLITQYVLSLPNN